tara:strand:+ start:953 stop:2284 length:1332 start_codon:yes stop_codon:yes gene_type:complete
MSKPTLTPDSKTSSVVLPITGTLINVDSTANPLPFGIYTRHHFEEQSREHFVSGAVDQVAYVYKKLGGDVLDVEITEYQVYAAYEEAVLEYSYIVNLHQTKNALGSSLGDMTGSFDQDGELRAAHGGDGSDLSSSLGGQRVELAYPKFDISFEKRIGDRAATEANIGGSQPIYSASLQTIENQQDYDVQALIYSASTTDNKVPYYGRLSSGTGKKKINIKKVFYKTPHAMWRFYGAYGGLSAVGNLSSYGQFADESTFEIVPTWQNKSQAKQYEDHLYTRLSHYSYELRNNKLRLFPEPISASPSKFWVEFTIDEEAWTEQDDRKMGVRGINNMNTMPFANIPFNNINAIGKQWIRRFALALAKEMLGLVRSKFGSIPIPGESITLNGSDLVSQAKDEQEKLREELKTTLDELTYQKLAESNAAIVDSSGKTLQGVPLPIHVG